MIVMLPVSFSNISKQHGREYLMQREVSWMKLQTLLQAPVLLEKVFIY